LRYDTITNNATIEEEEFQNTTACNSTSRFVPIAILTHRPKMLEQVLTSLKESGVNVRETVSLFYQSKVQHLIIPVAQKYKLRHYCTEATVLTAVYKFVLETLFDENPYSNYSIILEDDLIVSRDFKHYFEVLIGVMDSDPSVFCVSCWYDGGYPALIPSQSLADVDNPLLPHGSKTEIILRVQHFAGNK
jgi:hypothetical protein